MIITVYIKKVLELLVNQLGNYQFNIFIKISNRKIIRDSVQYSSTESIIMTY